MSRLLTGQGETGGPRQTASGRRGAKVSSREGGRHARRTLGSIDRDKIAATKPHGARVRYILGCRCLPCRAANSRYESERLAARKNGDWNGVVSSDAARTHLRKLRRRGVGLRAVADVTGISRTILQGIASGARAQCRKRTETAILAVDGGARSGGSIVPAGKTWRIIRHLLAEGYTKSELARRLGSKAKTPALQIRTDFVLASTAAKVERLYNRLEVV